VLTNSSPFSVENPSGSEAVQNVGETAQNELPDDPGQELLPTAEPEPQPPGGVPVQLEADRQSRVGDAVTADGHVVVHYRGYTIRADKVTYQQATTVLEAEGHLEVSGGPNDVVIRASHGDMNLTMHTARFYNVSGSQGLHSVAHTGVYSTSTPLLFTARVVLETGEGNYKLIDGTMTNCHLPRPDWEILSRAINLDDNTASTKNAYFKFLNIPLFYVPYLRHPANATGRESGFLIPVLSNSSIKGYVVGEQFYWAINRSMDMVIGSEYYSKRGWAPNGNFRYRGRGIDHLIVRWDALLDRGVSQNVSTAVNSTGHELVNQGGVDVVAYGRKDFTENTYAGGVMEYLSSYDYRLIFNDNFSQAISSQVASNVWFTHARNGRVPSLSMQRFETFASSTRGDEARILHLPNVRYDVLDRPLANGPLYWGLETSAGYLARSEPRFHARNVGRVDVYPHISLPMQAGGWSLVPEAAFRDTYYTISQVPDLTEARFGTPTISHDPCSSSGARLCSVALEPHHAPRD
jgi:LPS-assembly protein